MGKCNRVRPRKDESAREVIVVVEGEITEIQYLNDFKNRLISENLIKKEAARKLYITDNGKKSSPRKVFSRSQKEQKLHGAKFSFIVIDDDDRKESLEVLQECHYPQTANEVSKDKINCIYSNPCFEYWALLHFKNSGKEYASGELSEILSQYMPSYNKKNKVLTYNVMWEKEDNAAKNAASIRQIRQSTGKVWERPSTNVDVLLAFIREYFKV